MLPEFIRFSLKKSQDELWVENLAACKPAATQSPIQGRITPRVPSLERVIGNQMTKL
jgi:hypothetical protein